MVLTRLGQHPKGPWKLRTFLANVARRLWARARRRAGRAWASWTFQPERRKLSAMGRQTAARKPATSRTSGGGGGGGGGRADRLIARTERFMFPPTPTPPAAGRPPTEPAAGWRPDPGYAGRGPEGTGQVCDGCGAGPDAHEWNPDTLTSVSDLDHGCEHYTEAGEVLDDSATLEPVGHPDDEPEAVAAGWWRTSLAALSGFTDDELDDLPDDEYDALEMEQDL